MDSQKTLESLLVRIRRKLQILLGFNPGLQDCALCGKRVATMYEVIMNEETDGVPLCRSCFEAMLKKAAKDFRAKNFDKYLE